MTINKPLELQSMCLVNNTNLFLWRKTILHDHEECSEVSGLLHEGQTTG